MTSRRNSSIPSFADQKLDARRGAIFFLAEAGEDAADGLRQRQEFFFGNKRLEELGLLRHGAEAAADVDFESAFLFPFSMRVDGDAAHVVHVGQGRRPLALQPEKAILNFRPKPCASG